MGSRWTNWTEYVESARVRLLQQRDFRLQQLHELSEMGFLDAADLGAQEINEALRVAAQAALANADAALRRIEDGSYGRCRGCGGAVSTRRLDAVPSAPLCGSCHRAIETGQPNSSPPQRRLPGGPVGARQ